MSNFYYMSILRMTLKGYTLNFTSIGLHDPKLPCDTDFLHLKIVYIT